MFGKRKQDRHCGSMDSLPPPQDLVEDEVAAMGVRAAKEGVHAWPSLSDADRLIQVNSCIFLQHRIPPLSLSLDGSIDCLSLLNRHLILDFFSL